MAKQKKKQIKEKSKKQKIKEKKEVQEKATEETEKSDDESELEELIDTERLKEIVEKIKKESADKQISSSQFQEFIPTNVDFDEARAPVLDQVAQADVMAPIGQRIESDDTSETRFRGSEDDQLKYIPGASADEPKYTSDTPITQPDRIDLARVGREIPCVAPDIKQDAMFMKSPELAGISNQSQSMEKYKPAQAIDIDQAGRKKEEDKKYEPTLPK